MKLFYTLHNKGLKNGLLQPKTPFLFFGATKNSLTSKKIKRANICYYRQKKSLVDVKNIFLAIKKEPQKVLFKMKYEDFMSKG